MKLRRCSKVKANWLVLAPCFNAQYCTHGSEFPDAVLGVILVFLVSVGSCYLSDDPVTWKSRSNKNVAQAALAKDSGLGIYCKYNDKTVVKVKRVI